MLLQLLARLVARRERARRPAEAAPTAEDILALMNAGDARAAIPLLEGFLARHPDDVDALSNLACCLADTGNQERAGELLSKACLIDDTHFAASLNYARHLAGTCRSTEALDRLQRARTFLPHHAAIDSVLGAVALARGDARLASTLSARAWIALPDVLRAANCQLFHRAYADGDEGELASEHLFWAETAAPLPGAGPSAYPTTRQPALPPKEASRTRVAYWSPDLRDHSVRYFFRPILEHHDKSRFEVVVYHDSPQQDAQTGLIRAAADHFIDVSALPDAELLDMMRSHCLDVLVELAGHTSENRIRLLGERLAALQVTALGYPPTTGLATIDRKLMDEHIWTPDAARYYVEQPLVLPGSFWCFDPLEDFPIEPVPPAQRNGFVTFGVIGNIAKANPGAIQAWRAILEAVPASRLVVRSISFADNAVAGHFRAQLERSGLPMGRVDIAVPIRSGSELLKSYSDIDIVLDTFPFNGGTTTCFALHMGVPVVSRYGQSLISRMGLSALRNVGLDDWAVPDEATYVARAIDAAADIGRLRAIRAGMRARLRQSPLGNGALYTQNWEAALTAALAEAGTRLEPYCHLVRPLPATTMADRARAATRHGKADFSLRIVDYALRCYPDDQAGHLLKAELMAHEGRRTEAVAYRMSRLDALAPPDRPSALLACASDCLNAGDLERAKQFIDSIEPRALGPEEQIHAHLIGAAIDCAAKRNSRRVVTHQRGAARDMRFTVVVPCASAGELERVRASALGCLEGVNAAAVEFIACSEQQRGPAYRSLLAESSADVLVLVQKNVTFANPFLLRDVADTLEHCDALSFAGSCAENPLNWRYANSRMRSGCVLWGPRPEKQPGSTYETQLLGLMPAAEPSLPFRVLEGGFLALRRKAALACAVRALDPLLEEAGTLMEEAIAHEMARAGLKLGVHPCLGVVWNPSISLADRQEFDARGRLAEKWEMAVDPFEEPEFDRFQLCVPAETAADAFMIQQAALGGGRPDAIQVALSA